MSGSWWGPWYPRSWWGPWYPGVAVANPGNPPAGAATFVLLLEEGVTVTYTWQTDVFKPYSAKERRASRLDDPLQSIKGTALLVGSDVRVTRATLARYAALGRPFLIGLPYEELGLESDAVGTSVFASTVNADWTNPGQRVIVVASDNVTYAEAVIVSATSSEIVLSVSVGDVGRAGGRIMPALAWFLEAQQGFARYRRADGVERWQMSAQLAVAGFASASQAARLALEAPLTNSGVLDGVVLVARTAGVDGNAIMVTQTDDALSTSGEIEEDALARTVYLKYVGGITTVAEYVALLASSELVGISGTYAGTDILAAADDTFTATALSGGVDLTQAEMGASATLTTHAGVPVYDRRLVNSGTVGDSIHSMAEIVSLGAVPFSVGTATAADGGRQIAFEDGSDDEWQWLKKFLGTIKGSFKSFYLPTWRIDMVYVSRATVGGVTVLTVSGGDLPAWYPTQRSNVQVLQVDGSVTYAAITACVNASDGTSALTLSVLLSGVEVEMVSWLDLCRLEGDSVQVTFTSASKSAQFTARAIQVTTDPLGGGS